MSESKHLLLIVDSLPEEPASEVLEKEAERFVKTKEFSECEESPVIVIARHFAEWGRNHFEDKREMVSEDLEEDCSFEKILQEIYIKYDKKISIESLLDIASHFAEWQKQQMMKEAVEGEVVYQIGSAVIAPTDIQYKIMSDRVYIPNVKLGDKVKIIIVKEEQQ